MHTAVTLKVGNFASYTCKYMRVHSCCPIHGALDPGVLLVESIEQKQNEIKIFLKRKKSIKYT